MSITNRKCTCNVHVHFRVAISMPHMCISRLPFVQVNDLVERKAQPMHTYTVHTEWLNRVRAFDSCQWSITSRIVIQAKSWTSTKALLYVRKFVALLYSLACVCANSNAKITNFNAKTMIIILIFRFFFSSFNSQRRRLKKRSNEMSVDTSLRRAVKWFAHFILSSHHTRRDYLFIFLALEPHFSQLNERQ